MLDEPSLMLVIASNTWQGNGHLPTYLQVVKETHLAILEFSSTWQWERWQTFPEG